MAGTRLQIVGVFVLFTLLATPIAWHLTQVERTKLPVSRIRQLSWKNSRFGGSDRFKVDIYILSPNSAALPSVLPSSALNIVYAMHEMNLNEEKQELVQRSVKLEQQVMDDALKTLVPTSHKRFRIFLLCGENETHSTPLLMVGKYRHAWSLHCQVTAGDALHLAIEKLIQTHVYPQVGRSDKQKMKTTIARQALHYRMKFSLLNENPATMWTEDLQALVGMYLNKLVQKVGAIANFTVETQIVQYARLAKEITPSVDKKKFYINAEDLKHFKSANDFMDASVLSDGEQVLHFMAALPDDVHAPLYIRSVDEIQRKNALATSFELPGWGIVVIINPYAFEGRALNGDAVMSASDRKKSELQRIMGLFVSEIRTLLGIPSFLQRQKEEKVANGDASTAQLLFLPSASDGIADWELDVVMLERFTNLMQSAIETLQSTVTLVEALPNLSVLDRVQTRVESAVTRLEAILSDKSQEQQQDWVEVSDLCDFLIMARQASELTDAAYNDHTMIRQLYFPQDQQLGVYGPLLAPLILPFVLGSIREIKRYQAKRIAKKVKLQ